MLKSCFVIQSRKKEYFKMDYSPTHMLSYLFINIVHPGGTLFLLYYQGDGDLCIKAFQNLKHIKGCIVRVCISLSKSNFLLLNVDILIQVICLDIYEENKWSRIVFKKQKENFERYWYWQRDWLQREEYYQLVCRGLCSQPLPSLL